MITVKKLKNEWGRQYGWKSVLWFFLHFAILVVLCAVLLLWDKLGNLGAYMETHAANYLYALFCGFLLILILYCYFLFENKEILQSGKMITLVFSVLDLYIVISYLLGAYLQIYARPIAFVALMIFVLIGRKEAIFLNVMSALLMFVIDTFTIDSLGAKECYSSLIISFSAGMFAIFFCEKAKTRFRVVGIGILIVFPIDLVILILELSTLIEPNGNIIGEMPMFEGIITKMGYGLFGGVMSTVFFLTILPIFEGVFNCLTVFRLRELTSSDAQLLKRLKEEAIGTYNHSVTVSQLAEACAAAIGEDVDYARAAALYHDVGKLHYPEHFTENQGDYNLHDELTPELSADIIRSHAKDGYTLIHNSHLPNFLADVALQHHGTMPIRYFYAKALKLTDGELNIEDFSYLGPKPQTKIAAIVMIADAAEATVRALSSRSPEAVEKAIRSVIEERMDLEQFAECEITMVDLTKIRLALVTTLTGVYHHRIKYPNIKYKKSEDGSTKGEA
ncbi:MAG: HD domain-containing protein [Clostridia bacterium]|nr:HD domain-containing protein [Clostridia bacterium]